MTQTKIRKSQTVLTSPNGGRLTLTSGTPVTTSDVTGATTLYFTPYNGNKIELYNGTSWEVISFAETSLSLSGYTANKNYDIWAYNNAGTLALDSTVWTNDTTRATALTLSSNGYYTKTGDATRKYLGTIRITGTTGQCESSLTSRLVWNYFNRVQLDMFVNDAVESWWTYATVTWRPYANKTSMRFNFVVGVQDEIIEATASAMATAPVSAGGGYGIGLDSTSANSAQVLHEVWANSTIPLSLISTAYYSARTSAGFHYLQWLEYARTGTMTFMHNVGQATEAGGMFGSLMG